MTFIKLLELKDEKLKEMNQRVIIVLHQHSILQIYNCSSNWVIRDKRGWIDDTGMEFSFRRYPSNILAGERRINEGSADDGQRASGSRFDRVSILLQRVTRRVTNETRLNGANEVIEKQCNGNSLAKLPIEPRWIQAESGPFVARVSVRYFVLPPDYTANQCAIPWEPAGIPFNGVSRSDIGRKFSRNCPCSRAIPSRFIFPGVDHSCCTIVAFWMIVNFYTHDLFSPKVSREKKRKRRKVMDGKIIRL